MIIAKPAQVAKAEYMKQSRSDRYELLAGIREMGIAQGRKAELKHPLNFHRTCKCRYIPLGNGNVSVHQHQDTGNAFYGGLQICGSVWTCPVCAAKIEAKREVEISKFFTWAYKKGRGKKVVMVTFTFPHSIDQPLKENLDAFLAALRKLRAGAPWKRIKDRNGFDGLIRALEINHGVNGWHPHTHELWCVDESVNTNELQATVTNRWMTMLKKAGLLLGDDKAARRYAVDIKDNMSATQYLTKHGKKTWGGDRELAKASTKKGKKAGRSPFQLAADAAGGCGKSEALWWEYVRATKGKSRLYWSEGLKGKVGITDKKDEVLAAEQTEKADLLGLLTTKQWKAVRASGRSTAGLLEAAESGGWAAVENFISNLINTSIEQLKPG